ncbi:unnamed protein product [Lymnaea stagnalis]|uniref:Coiled-coil domain-containing protein 171 n=1 Tax=Lymnaea stagnalis TaxID=6523 RepID=A0AAV2I0S6_LYMST
MSYKSNDRDSVHAQAQVLNINSESNLQELSLSSNLMLEKEVQAGLLSFMAGESSSSQFSSEINRLRLENSQLKLDLQAEHDNLLQLKKKLNNGEKQKLETASKTNQEIASLETQLAKIRSQVEKGEAVRQSLEYELAKSQRDVNHIQQVAREKENILLAGTDDLKKKIVDLSDEVKRLQKSLQSIQDCSHEQENKLKENLQETKQKLIHAQSELSNAINENEKLNELCQQHSSFKIFKGKAFQFNKTSELFFIDFYMCFANSGNAKSKIKKIAYDKRNSLESLRLATAEIEYAKERDAMTRSELEAALSRIKILEENIEAERSAHLETKFNSEIVQLRVRDLDSAIDVEKSANREANKAVERLAQQCRELERVYEEERKLKKEAAQKLDKMDKEYTSMRRQLLLEVEDKKSVIVNLSRELETHQKNFNELKSELTKVKTHKNAKKRQQFLEETYEGSIKELEFLLQTFHFEDKKLSRQGEATSVSKGKKVANPSIVVESFKQMLVQMKKKLDAQAEELVKSKKGIDKLTKELESCRELIKTKDKALEDAQKSHSKAVQDLQKTRSNYTELETTIGKLKTSLQINTNNQDKDRTRIQELSEEIMKLVKRRKTEEEDRMVFLQELYQLLNSSQLCSLHEKKFNQFSWDDLKDVVFEQVSSLIDLLQTTDGKLKSYNTMMREHQDIITELKQTHTDQISRLTNTVREKEQSWQRQREELEQHYSQMLNDLQSRSKKTQAIADQAWEKVRATGNVQQGLESELLELRRQLAESQITSSSLLSACALLSGALYPLYTRASLLSSERHILEELYSKWENCRDRGIYLSCVLSSGKESDQDTPKDTKILIKKHPLLKFRVGVITVLAANRLAFLGRGFPSCFVTYSSTIGHAGLSFKTGTQEQKHLKFSGLVGLEEEDNSFISSSSTEQANNLTSWLNSPTLLQTILASMTELQEVTQENKLSNSDSRTIVSVARSTLSKLVDRLSSLFPTLTYPAQSSLRDRSSLLRKLEKNLSHILENTPINLKGNIISSQELMSNLKNHILELTQRLETVEKERRRLLTELSELKQQIGEDNSGQQDTEKDNAKVSYDTTKYVPVSKFERVCAELSSALRREQKAQSLLQEQSNQLTELTSRLDLCTSDEIQKQTTLISLQEALSEAQKELRHKEQSLRHTGKLINRTEYERNSLQSNLNDAENALLTAIRDKEVLTLYITNVESAMEKAKKQFIIHSDQKPLSGDMSLSRFLLDADLIPQDIGRAGPELIAIQNLVGCFIEAQNQAVNKIRALMQEITSHRDHIDILKQELNNVAHREYNQQVDETTDSVTAFNGESGTILFPLRHEQDVSLEDSPSKTPKTVITPPIYHSKKSAFHSVKSRNHQTSKKSPSHN